MARTLRQKEEEVCTYNIQHNIAEFYMCYDACFVGCYDACFVGWLIALQISELRSRLVEKDGEVTRARQAAHAAGMERQEQARAIGELRGELGALRDQLQQKQASVQVCPYPPTSYLLCVCVF